MNRAVLFLLALFLVTPGAAWIAGVQGSSPAFENRSLHARPALTGKALWDGSFGKAYSDYVWDRIPFRPQLLRAEHGFEWYVLDEPPLTSVVRGEHDFLFVKDRSIGIHAGGANPDELIASVQRIEAAYAAAGIRLVIAVSPSKASIYRDYLTPRYRAAFDATVAPAEDALVKHGGTVLDLWTPMRAARERWQAPRSLFRAGDLHWHLEAGRVQAKTIVDAIDPALWDERAAPSLSPKTTMSPSELNNIYFKVGPREPYATLVPSKLVVPKKEREALLNNTTQLYRYTTADGDKWKPDPRHVFVIRDSFLSSVTGEVAPAQDGGMDTIAPFFQDVAFLHWTEFTEHPKDWLPKLAGSDIVVIQVVQTAVANLIVHEGLLIEAAKHARQPRPPPATVAPLPRPLRPRLIGPVGPPAVLPAP